MVVACLLFFSRKYRKVVWLLLGLAVTELFMFAHGSLDYFDFSRVADQKVKEYLQSHPGDYRILDVQGIRANAALSWRVREIWGYDPGVLRRYAQFLAVTQNIDPDDAVSMTSEAIPFSRDHPLLGMLRCRFVFIPKDGKSVIYERTNYLPHLLLVQHYHVLKGRNAILSALADKAFDPRQEVILETEPDPKPAPTAEPGNVRLVNSSTDELTIEAEVKSPSILLITDTYAKGWRARALPGSSQASYHVIPANYCLRAIPLAAGHHLLRLEYAPLGFRIGKWVSMISVGIFLVLVGRQASRLVSKHNEEATFAKPK